MRRNLCLNPKRSNPRVGSHPDLFEGKDTPVVKALEDMSYEEIVVLPRDAFSEDEWERLDRKTQEEVLSNAANKPWREARDARIDNMVVEFVKRHEWVTSPDAQSFDDDLDHQFDAIDNFIDRARHYYAFRGHNPLGELYADFHAEGFSDEQIDTYLEEALADRNNYDYSYDTSEYGRAFIKAGHIGSFYIDRDDLDAILEGMEDDEIEEALDEINRKTYLNLDPDNLYEKYGLEIDDYSRAYADADPDWDKIRAAVNRGLSSEDPAGAAEEAATDPEERILHRYKDGSYLIDLLPSELPAEGKEMGICVGQAQYGYAKAVRDGRTKILSLRTASGRPKFTFEMELAHGKPVEIRQIKGKANRLPGWDRGQTGQGTPKRDEVEKVIEAVKALGFEPEEVADLEPAVQAMYGKKVKTNPAHDDEHCGFCCPR